MADAVTRRGLVGSAAGAAAGAALSSGAWPERAVAVGARRVDVVVVGAGLAGLSAARELVRDDRSVVVLEARDRVGGRTWTADIAGGAWVDIGGQWVGPGQDRVLGLIASLGLRTFRTFEEGYGQYIHRGHRSLFKGFPPLSKLGTAEAVVKMLEIGELSKGVPAEAPYRAERAEEWDSQTAETWIEENVVSEDAKALIRIMTEGVFAADTRDFSFLHFLFYVRTAGASFLRLILSAGGAQESRVVGGTQQLSKRLAAKLDKRVQLNAPVRRIEQRGRRVVVISDRGVFEARHVIVAIAPTLAGDLVYDPPLPPLRAQLTQRVPMGAVIKCQAVYREPFWRNAGLNGISLSDQPPILTTLDNSPPGGRPGILIGFIEGRQARIWTGRPAAQRRRAVLEAFARRFGPKARSPIRYIEGNWPAQLWSRGCYVGYMPTGVWSDFGPALRAPAGRIHWREPRPQQCGTATWMERSAQASAPPAR